MNDNGEPCGCGTGHPCPSHVENGNGGPLAAFSLGGMSLDQLASVSLIALVALQFWTYFTKRG